MSLIVSHCPSPIEREQIASTISRAIPGTEIISASSMRAALDSVGPRRVDMLIADVYIFDVHSCEMISEAKRLWDDMTILVTSAADREYVSSYAWRLGIDDFLLKPYRPSWLAAAVTEMLRSRQSSVRQEPKSAEAGLDAALAAISELIETSQYLKCTEEAKKYLDDIFARAENDNAARRESHSFVRKVSSLRAAADDQDAIAIKRELAKLDKRTETKTAKYDAYAACDRIIDMMIDDASADSTRRIINFIDRSARRGVSLNEAAEFANMSSYYFSKFFKRLTGVNFISYVTERKMDAARMMLEETDMPIVNIASELSYHETNYFSKAFRKWVGMTPTEYREQKNICGRDR